MGLWKSKLVADVHEDSMESLLQQHDRPHVSCKQQKTSVSITLCTFVVMETRVEDFYSPKLLVCL
jgi:hypothetical protein